MLNIKGKNVLLTGASRGLGLHIAQGLAAEGVNIALTARSETGLKKTEAELSRYGIKSEIYPADICNEAARLELIDRVKADFGCIDILINNAGVEWVSAYTDLAPEKIEAIVQTNMISSMVLTRLVLPEMLARKSGHIVTMSSLGGKKGSPYSATYAATKAGLIQWSHALRNETYGTGVSASVLCPGFVSDSGMFAAYGKSAPKIAGESTPSDVVTAVLGSIKKDLAEIIVNPGPTKLMMAVDLLHPDIMPWLLRKLGVHEFYRKQAEDNKKSSIG